MHLHLTTGLVVDRWTSEQPARVSIGLTRPWCPIRKSAQGPRRVIGIQGQQGIREHTLTSQSLQRRGSSYEAGWEGWDGTDDFMSIFACMPPPAGGGIGVQLYDQDHNLPPGKAAFQHRRPIRNVPQVLGGEVVTHTPS